MKLEVVAWNDAAPPTEELVRQRLADEGFDVFRWHDVAAADAATGAPAADAPPGAGTASPTMPMSPAPASHCPWDSP